MESKYATIFKLLVDDETKLKINLITCQQSLNVLHKLEGGISQAFSCW
jgi:hypothetical protein